MQSIIRVEHPESGKGIFRHDLFDLNSDNQRVYDEMCDRHNSFPTPYEDQHINRFIRTNEFCAFKSIEQIQQWIQPNEFQVIIELGFKIYLLDVSECTIGEYQILYKKEHILQQKDISNLFITN